MDAAQHSFVKEKEQYPVKLFFQDEGRFGRINNIQKCWFVKGSRPQVKQQMIREYIYAYSSVCPQTGETFSLIMPTADGASMQYYMDEMSRHFNEARIILCMDNAAWHKAEDINMPDNMISWFLPPYSPELNPVEILWKHIRVNYFNNRTFESLDEVETQLVEALMDVYNSKTDIAALTLFNWMDF